VVAPLSQLRGRSAGRPAVAGTALPGTTMKFATFNGYEYGSILRTCSTSAGFTSTDFFK